MATETPPKDDKQPSSSGVLKNALKKLRGRLQGVFSKDRSFEENLTNIEHYLLSSDFGTEMTANILKQLQKQGKKTSLAECLHDILMAMLQSEEASSQVITASANTPTVILLVGVNGSGKTTTAGKLAQYFSKDGQKVMLVAGDTYRAAAVAQLKVWGQRTDTEVFAKENGKPAAVVYDALASANAKNIDWVIIDTAGRMENRLPLMDELTKVTKVASKIDPTAPHEVWLVLDAALGRAALQQAEGFIASAAVTGIILTRLDGSARGGSIFEISQKLNLPVKFIGIGENLTDLHEFNPASFVEALLTDF